MNDQTIRVGVISDTHGLLRREVVQHLQGCSHILHAGDIIRQSDLDELALYGNLYAVRGNNDLWNTGVCDLKPLLRFEIGGVRFLMTHDRWDLPRNTGDADVIVTGHTHRYSEERKDGQLWLNPGSCGRARFGGEVTMAILTLRDGRADRVYRIDLE